MLDKNFTQLLLIALFTANVSLADDDIIVSADRIKSTLDKSPSDIKVFEKSDIEKSTSIFELLNTESDIQLAQSGPVGGNTSLFLRGTDSSHTLVIIDGITMNDPSNPNRQFDLGRLSLNNIERIEILKGSQGLLYGSNAIGGVILITTKQAQDKASGSALVDYGTFDTFNSAINVQKKFNAFGLSLGIDHLKTRGFSAANIKSNPNADDDGEKRTTISGALNQSLTKNDELVFNYRYVNDTVDLDKGGGPKNDDLNDSQFTEQQFMKAGYGHKWTIAETQLIYTKSLHHRTLNVRADNANPAASSVISTGGIDSVAVNHTQYTTDFLTQNFNFDYQHEEDQLKNFNENLSFFLYNRFEYGPAILNFGARLDSNKYFGEHVTYKVAVMHTFNTFNLKMSYSTGFRAPSLNQLYDSTYGNKKLNPEESQTAEIGFDVPFSERSKYTGTFFYTDLHNRLSYDPNTFVNQNRGDARIIGFENNFNAKIGNGFDAGLSATWLSARDMTTKQKLARRPNINSKLSLNYKKEKNSAGLEGDFKGKRLDVDNAGNLVSMPSHTIFNVNYTYEFNQSFSTYVKIKNILDKDYEEVFGYGTGGRAYTTGLKYIF
ncbi:MAG: TonB-dependent receptor [Bacteriovorax sp.]|nr:TonB-dependent receptor [Bacteriovorax sp.]